MDKLKEITTELLKQIGEDVNREGLIKTPARVANAWRFLTKGYSEDIQTIVNGAIWATTAARSRLAACKTLASSSPGQSAAAKQPSGARRSAPTDFRLPRGDQLAT